MSATVMAPRNFGRHRRRRPSPVIGGLDLRASFATIALAVVILASCGTEDGAGSGTTSPTPAPDATHGVDAQLEIHYEHPDAAFDYRIDCGETDTVSGDTGPADVDADAACRSLAEPAVVERLTTGPPEDRVCTEIYGGPDVAEINGTIGGESVDATITRENGCAINDWDDTLAALLPPPLGVTDP